MWMASLSCFLSQFLKFSGGGTVNQAITTKEKEKFFP